MRMLLIALTGSIGMGKSTTLKMFADEGIPVWDADAAVHKLYGPDASGATAIAELVPTAVTEAGVDREKLRSAILTDETLLKKIEAAIHPLVAQDRAEFLAEGRAGGHGMAICDIPLLFETGGDKAFDKVIVVSAPADVQRTRVLARPGMTEAAFDAILAKQTPDSEKRERADYVIDTSVGIEEAREQVRSVIEKLGALRVA